MHSPNGLARLTADIVIEHDDGSIILIRRGSPPFKGAWAIPGGKLEGDEAIEETAIREAQEETGLVVQLMRIIGVYSKPDRDPRGRFVSVAFVARPIGGTLKAASDAREVLRTNDFADLSLAFDHKQILLDYVRGRQ